MGYTDANNRSSRGHDIFCIEVERRQIINILGGDRDSEKDNRISCKGFTPPSNQIATLRSTLYLVDLAGSESVRNTGDFGGRRLREGVNINRSLLSISRVISALGSEGDISGGATTATGNVNYRDSKLTRILYLDLARGRARVSFICCTSLEVGEIEENQSTLLFSDQDQLVCTRPKVNTMERARERCWHQRTENERILGEEAEQKLNGPRMQLR